MSIYPYIRPCTIYLSNHPLVDKSPRPSYPAYCVLLLLLVLAAVATAAFSILFDYVQPPHLVLSEAIPSMP